MGKLKTPTHLGGVTFKRIADIKTNGLKMSRKRTGLPNDDFEKQKLIETSSAVPSLKTIANIITFIRRSIDQKAKDEQKSFYIGIGSYTINAEPNDDPKSSAVRTAQITALSDRYDERKIEAFDSVVKKYQKTEMVLLYDTVINPN